MQPGTLHPFTALHNPLVENEMSYNMDDLRKLLSSPNAVTTTDHGSSTPKPINMTSESLISHFERLETRMDRIEGALNKILDHLHLSAVDDDDGRQGIKLYGSILQNQENTMIADTVNRNGMQHPSKEPTVGEESDRQYTYTPLDTTRSQIRILMLHRAEELSDPLIADLVTVGMDDGTIGKLMYGFVALAYTWGPPVFDGSVLLEGCKFPITTSLEAALRQLRFSYKNNPTIEINGRLWGNECWCWVDQICKLVLLSVPLAIKALWRSYVKVLTNPTWTNAVIKLVSCVVSINLPCRSKFGYAKRRMIAPWRSIS